MGIEPARNVIAGTYTHVDGILRHSKAFMFLENGCHWLQKSSVPGSGQVSQLTTYMYISVVGEYRRSAAIAFPQQVNRDILVGLKCGGYIAAI